MRSAATGFSFTKHISETHIVLIVSALTVSVNIMFENLAIIDRLAEVFCLVLPARYSCNRCDGVATQPLGQLPGAGNNHTLTSAIGGSELKAMSGSVKVVSSPWKEQPITRLNYKTGILCRNNAKTKYYLVGSA